MHYLNVMLTAFLCLTASLFFPQPTQAQCGTPVLPNHLSISAHYDAGSDAYRFTPLCDGVPCREGYYLYFWEFSDQDFSLERLPQRSFGENGLRTVELTIETIKEQDDPDARYSICDQDFVRAGGCVSVIQMGCPRQKKKATATFQIQKSRQVRVPTEYAEALECQRGNFAALLSAPDGAPIPGVELIYNVVLHNRSNCEASVNVDLEAKIGREHCKLKRHPAADAFRFFGEGRDKMSVETTLQSGEVVMVPIVVIVPQNAKLVDKELKAELKAEFDTYRRTAACGKDKVRYERKDVARFAIDPSHLTPMKRSKLKWGEKVDFRMVFTNDGDADAGLITVINSPDSNWNEDYYVLKHVKINGKKLRRTHNHTPGPGEFKEDHILQDGRWFLRYILHPRDRNPLGPGGYGEILYKLKLKDLPPVPLAKKPKHAGVKWFSQKLKKREVLATNCASTLFENEGTWHNSPAYPQVVVKKVGAGTKVARVVGLSAIVAGITYLTLQVLEDPDQWQQSLK